MPGIDRKARCPQQPEENAARNRPHQYHSTRAGTGERIAGGTEAKLSSCEWASAVGAGGPALTAASSGPRAPTVRRQSRIGNGTYAQTSDWNSHQRQDAEDAESRGSAPVSASEIRQDAANQDDLLLPRREQRVARGRPGGDHREPSPVEDKTVEPGSHCAEIDGSARRDGLGAGSPFGEALRQAVSRGSMGAMESGKRT